MTDTPIYDQLVRELYAERTKEAYAASPGMIGCGQWEMLPEDFERPPRVATRRTRIRPT